MINTSVPVLFIIFNRLSTEKRVFEAIRRAKPVKLYVAADGPRNDYKEDKWKCKQAREYIKKNIDWECDVKFKFKKKNLGCKKAVVDAIDWGINKIRSEDNKKGLTKILKKIDPNKEILLVTMHRRESFGEDINNICRAIKKIALDFKHIQVVYPVHLNPNVRKPVFDILSNIENIVLLDPLDYRSFLWLMDKSYFIITDSGGIQEEAPALKKPVLVIRNKTERNESVELGISRLVGTGTYNIEKNISELLNSKKTYNRMVPSKNPYGDGRAAEKIADIVFDKFS